jgi:hypothetical protein
MTNLLIRKHLYSILDGYYSTTPFSHLTLENGSFSHIIQMLFCSNVLSRIKGSQIPHTTKISLIVPLGIALLGKIKKFDALSQQINKHLSQVITAVVVVSLFYLFYQGERIYAGVALAGMAARFAFCKSDFFLKIDLITSGFSKLLVGPKLLKIIGIINIVAPFLSFSNTRLIIQKIDHFFGVDDSEKAPPTIQISKNEMVHIFNLNLKELAIQLEVERSHIYCKQQRDDLEGSIVESLKNKRREILKKFFKYSFQDSFQDYMFSIYLTEIFEVFFLFKNFYPFREYLSPVHISGYLINSANLDYNLIKSWWKRWITEQYGEQALEKIQTFERENSLFGENLIDGEKLNKKYLIPILLEIGVFKIKKGLFQ